MRDLLEGAMLDEDSTERGPLESVGAAGSAVPLPLLYCLNSAILPIPKDQRL